MVFGVGVTTRIFEITHEDVNKLNDIQLPQLLKKLLLLETEKNEITDCTIHVSLAIKQKDGGEDGRITWDHPSKDKTEFFPGKSLLFQSKQRRDPADFAASHCEKELISKDKSTGKIRVKERIDTLFSENGTYILFCNFPCNLQMITERIEGFRKGLRLAEVPYAETCDIQVYCGEKIADWTNKFPAAVTYVCECIGRSMPLGVQTWTDWADYQKNKNTFFSDQIIDEKLGAIRQHFSSKQKVARIIGHSGLGKTRLALEAFRYPELKEPEIIPPDKIYQCGLSESVVYIDATEVDDLIPTVRHWRQNGLSGILVIDECDCKTHERLSEEVKHSLSSLSMISIDYTENCGIEDPVIKLERTSDEIIESIILEQFPKLPKSDVKRIVDIAQGYPQMAVLIAKDRSLGAASVGTISKKEIINRLISGRADPTDTVKKVVTACSLFTSFRVRGDRPTHVDFIAQNICKIDPAEFYRVMMEIKDQQGILDERGRFFGVIPKPLAITLATEWWKYCSQEEAEQLLLGSEIPQELVNPLCDQFRYLNLEPEIEELSKELCKERRPFGQAGILSSQRGSRIFRSIAEVNPPAAADALYRCFREFDKASLREIGPGRRNLIWALECLCFWESTFSKSASLLLKFAVSESEPGLSNNATGQFYQLFHYLLSGTQAPPDMRLAVIDAGLSTNDPEYQTICISALGHALKTHHFSRMGGVETQGSRYPHEDWRPTTWKEVFDYWDNSLIRLKKYAVMDNAIGCLARTQIEDSIIGMLWYGRLNTLEDVIFSTCEIRGCFWPKVLYQLKWFINHYSKDIPLDGKDRISNWIEILGPKTAKELAYTIVVHPEKFETFEGEDFTTESAKMVEVFVKTLTKQPDDLDDVLNYLYRTHSAYGHLFGYTLGNTIEKKEEFIDKSLAILKSISAEQMDESVLGGYLLAIRKKNSDLVNDCLERIAEDIKLSPLLLSLTARATPEKRDLDRLIEQLKKGTISIEDFRVLKYGSALTHFDSNVVTGFLDELLSISGDGCPVVFEIAYMYTFEDESKMRECASFFKRLLINQRCFYNILKNAAPNTSILHEVNQVSVALLEQKDPDSVFASQIVKEIIELCLESPDLFVYSHDFGALITLLVSPRYVETTWPILGHAIITRNYRVYYRLKDIVGGKASYGEWDPSLLERIPLSLISKWCEENREKAPYFLAEAVLPLIWVENKIVWSPLAKYLLNNYGNDSKVLNGLTGKMYNYSWYGSQIPFYEMWLSGFSILLNHKNPTVKMWAEKNIEYVKRMIQETRSDEEEEDLYCC